MSTRFLSLGPVLRLCAALAALHFTLGNADAQNVVPDRPAVLVKRAPQINGYVEGSLSVGLGEPLYCNSAGEITGELRLLGSPSLLIRGSVDELREGGGAEMPEGYTVLINDQFSLGTLVTLSVEEPFSDLHPYVASVGRVSKNLNRPADSIEDFSDVRDININSNYGDLIVPAGSYGNISVNSGCRLVLGTDGSEEPEVYCFDRINFNSGSELVLLGPVVLVFNNGLAWNDGPLGDVDHPEWLMIELPHGGININSRLSLYGHVRAPYGSVNINSDATLVGSLECAYLNLNSGGRIIGRSYVSTQPANEAPWAQNLSLEVFEDGELEVLLHGEDPEGADLSFFVQDGPAHGVLSGEAPDLVYQPEENFYGEDSFTYLVNDGVLDSEIATVSLRVLPVNDAPVAHSQELEVDEDASVSIELVASDPEGDELTYRIVEEPVYGVLQWEGNHFTYSPNPNSTQADRLTFLASDGELDSNEAEVIIQVTALNDAPVAYSQTLQLDEDVMVEFSLSGSDVDGDELLYALTDLPQNGRLYLNENLINAPPGEIEEGASFRYEPDADFDLEDGFGFIVSDGDLNASGNVAFEILPVNDRPVILPPLEASIEEDTILATQLFAEDVDGDSLQFSVVLAPESGKLALSADGGVEYTPAPDFFGSDTFQFQVSDGALSALGEFSVEVLPVNDAPNATVFSVETDEDTVVDVLLLGRDPEGDTLTFAVVEGPEHGVLSGEGAELVYEPLSDYCGTDHFTYQVSDDELDSEVVSIPVIVNPINDLPVAEDLVLETDEDTPLDIALSGFDPEGDPLEFTITQQAEHGVLSGAGSVYEYVPEENFFGEDQFFYTVSDGFGTSEEKSVSIHVLPVNDLPVAHAQTVELDEDSSLLITLTGLDVENSQLDYCINVDPSNGELVGSGNAYTYTPNEGFYGADQFAFLVNDGSDDSEDAWVSITVNHVNHPPVADDLDITVTDQEPVAIVLQGSDPDLDPLDYSLISEPVHGSLSGTLPNLEYTLSPDFVGSGTDAFRYVVSDGQVLVTASVHVSILSINGMPQIVTDEIEVDEDETALFDILVSDPDGDQFFVSVLQEPDLGSFSFVDGTCSYSAPKDYFGKQNLLVSASDGKATVEKNLVINVFPVNDLPVVDDLSLVVQHGLELSIVPSGFDVENDELEYVISKGPEHGIITETAAGWSYMPDSDFVGFDTLEYLAFDGTDYSFPATITIEVYADPVSKTWTTTDDFLEGDLFNIDTKVPGQIQASIDSGTFRYIWVAVSSKGTIVRIDTETGEVVGEYQCSPDGQPKDPSRTTVDNHGGVWAGNRGGNKAIHIVTPESGLWVDKNGNGKLDTSTGLGDVLPWTNEGSADSNGGVSTAEDELILHYVPVTSSGVRHVSVTDDNNVWISGTGGRNWDLVDGSTGEIIRHEDSVGYGGYGGLITPEGVIWSSRPLLLRHLNSLH